MYSEEREWCYSRKPPGSPQEDSQEDPQDPQEDPKEFPIIFHVVVGASRGFPCDNMDGPHCM